MWRRRPENRWPRCRTRKRDWYTEDFPGQVAQLVERSPEKAGVGGSIPSLATTPKQYKVRLLTSRTLPATTPQNASLESIWSPNSATFASMLARDTGRRRSQATLLFLRRWDTGIVGTAWRLSSSSGKKKRFAIYDERPDTPRATRGARGRGCCGRAWSAGRVVPRRGGIRLSDHGIQFS